MTAKEKLKELALKGFKVPKASRKARPCRLRLASTGEFIELRSGKSLWNSPGFAKSALLNHVKETAQMSEDWKLGSAMRNCAKELAHEMLADGTVELVML
jgi:hypothetical protein